MSSTQTADEILEQRKAQFQAALEARSGRPASAASPATPPTPAAAPDVPADAEPPSVEPEAAPEPPSPSRWRRRVKALDEEREVDLEAMPEAELDALIGRGLAHETVKERYKSRVHALEDAVETERKRAASARDDYWQNQLVARGYRVERDPATGALNLVAPQAQTAPAAPPAVGQADLDALERAAMDEGTSEAWAAYTRAIRQAAVGRTLTPQDVERIVAERLEESRRVSAQEQEAQRALARATQEFQGKITAAFDTRKGDFEGAADPETFRDIALAEASRRADQIKAARAEGREISAQDAERFVLAGIHRVADLAKSSVQTAQRRLAESASAGKPRPRAPTVVPAGGAPAPASVDPTKIDRTTPAGKKQAEELLQRLIDERSSGRAPARV